MVMKKVLLFGDLLACRFGRKAELRRTSTNLSWTSSWSNPRRRTLITSTTWPWQQKKMVCQQQRVKRTRESDVGHMSSPMTCLDTQPQDQGVWTASKSVSHPHVHSGGTCGWALETMGVRQHANSLLKTKTVTCAV
ncbi:hypothetical protein ILYODFUR_038215 [Ilyodon furcidens]|uniref:Secreted protein n=1 Tax=Ilyodon furcidens TaxID=33524 RepID=A0ABV0U308_9TELE